VYVRDPGIIVRRDNGQRMNPQAFVTHAYANRHYFESGDGGTKRRPAAKRWMEWPRRFELEKITYQPGAAPVVDDKWNTWRGWGCTPKPGTIKPWKELLDFLFKDAEPGARRWFEQWCAYPLQHPGTKLFSSVLMWGVHQGTGKTMVAYAMRGIYGSNFIELKAKDLQGSFNSWAENKQFVYGDEITGADRSGKKLDADYLKGIITQEELRINAKFVPEFVVRDVINYYFSSNHPDTFFMEDTDRRNFINEVVGRPLPKVFYKEVEKWLKQGEGPAHLFEYLLGLDLTGFDPAGDAFHTASKRAMINDGKSDLSSWVHALREDPTGLLRAAHMNGASECALFTPHQLHDVYDPGKKGQVSVNGLSRELKRSGFRQVNGGGTVRVSTGTCVRLYAVREEEKWTRATPAECGAHWDKFFGPKGAKHK
jgi:hypothetical protein